MLFSVVSNSLSYLLMRWYKGKTPNLCQSGSGLSISDGMMGFKVQGSCKKVFGQEVGGRGYLGNNKLV